MIQPYFDPTNYFQGGSVFSQYLQGFVKERSAMNKQMMEIALAQSDPSFLQDQIQIMNKNIIELEKAKAKALQGDTKYNKQLMSLVTQQMNKESQGILEVGRERVKRGGKAAIAMTQAAGMVAGVLGDASLTATQKNQKLKGLFNISDIDVMKALRLEIESAAKTDRSIDLTKAVPATVPTVNRSVFMSQGGADRVQMPDARTQTKKALKIMEEIGGGGQVSAESQAALAAQIDAAIAKYEAQRAGYEQQLADLQEGGVDPFSGFSRNYMLDNPFIQMSRSQGKVDALASAIEAAQEEDFRTPFARVEREAATPQDILSGNVYDADDEFFEDTFAKYYQKRMSDYGVPMTPDMDADELAIMNRQGVRQSTTERKPTFDNFSFIPPPEPEPDLTPGGPSAAAQRLQQIEQSYGYDPRSVDTNVVSIGERPFQTMPQSGMPVTPSADLRGIGTGIGETYPNIPAQLPQSYRGPNQPLTPGVRETELDDVSKLDNLIRTGEIIPTLSADQTEIVYEPYTRAAVQALQQQIRIRPGPYTIEVER